MLSHLHAELSGFLISVGKAGSNSLTLLSSCVSRLDYSVYSLPVLTQINGKNKQKDVNPRKIFFKPAKY